ncbi:hypothetical protein AW67_34110 [Salmonella enterica subsp. enterica serovar Montevideo str. USDA-ARS-USMARC-1903]|nr:hypothetical protein AW67_34110 [Salmonella enterica subsp. enterica serovar Montevideo str. USDA-ARS-USMARC-1903]
MKFYEDCLHKKQHILLFFVKQLTAIVYKNSYIHITKHNIT